MRFRQFFKGQQQLCGRSICTLEIKGCLFAAIYVAYGEVYAGMPWRLVGFAFASSVSCSVQGQRNRMQLHFRLHSDANGKEGNPIDCNGVSYISVHFERQKNGACIMFFPHSK